MSSSYGSAVLRIRDFRLLILNKFLLTFGVQMIGVIVGWQIYQITKDPLSWGLIGFSEAIAFIEFALWAGHTADRTEKRFLILMSEFVTLICALALCGLTWTGHILTLPIYFVIAVSGVSRAFLWSSSTSFVDIIVPEEIYSSAAAWNSSAWEIASILGPASGGLVYGIWGPQTAYTVATVFIAAALYFALKLGKRPPVAQGEAEPIFESLLTGIRFVFKNQVILGALALDMFAVLFGGVVAVLPIFAEILHVGPIGLGLLRASPSAGAITMAVIQMRRPSLHNTGRRLLTAVSVFGVCIIAFGLSRNFNLSMTLLTLAAMRDTL